MGNFDKLGSGDIGPPRFNIMICAITPVIPIFFVILARVGTEQHATRFQCVAQFLQHTGQLTDGNMKQRSISEYAVEVLARQMELTKILTP